MPARRSTRCAPTAPPACAHPPRAARTQQRIRALEATPGGFKTEEYRLLNEVLEAAFTVRTYPAPDCFQRAAGLLNEEIYVGMQGASEFTIGGVLASWSVTAQLPRVRTPTLLTHGRFDTMRPPVLRAMAAALPKAITTLEPSTHSLLGTGDRPGTL